MNSRALESANIISFIKTTNGGINWLTYDVLTYGQNWSMDFVDENTGYAGGSRTYKTTNGGLNWSTLDFGFNLYSADIQFINQNTGFIGGNDETSSPIKGVILKTTNAGLSWQKYTFPEPYSYILDIDFLNENFGYATNGYEILKTTDGGSSFSEYRTCVGNGMLALCFTDSITGYCVGSNGMIIKTTNGGGNPIRIAPISNQIPEKYSLSQNYPNPFNPSTKIKFDIPSSGTGLRSVRLIIYDVIGREVTTLVNKSLKPGSYEVDWNGSSYASGIYFYSLITDNFAETKKMVLIK